MTYDDRKTLAQMAEALARAAADFHDAATQYSLDPQDRTLLALTFAQMKVRSLDAATSTVLKTIVDIAEGERTVSDSDDMHARLDKMSAEVDGLRKTLAILAAPVVVK